MHYLFPVLLIKIESVIATKKLNYYLPSTDNKTRNIKYAFPILIEESSYFWSLKTVKIVAINIQINPSCCRFSTAPNQIYNDNY